MEGRPSVHNNSLGTAPFTFDEREPMSWLLLLLAALAETAFVLEMKLSDGFTKLGHSIASVLIMILGVYLLSIVVRRIPVATAYAIWTGLGVIGTVLIEHFAFAQPFSIGRMICITLILAGVVGLKIL